MLHGIVGISVGIVSCNHCHKSAQLQSWMQGISRVLFIWYLHPPAFAVQTKSNDKVFLRLQDSLRFGLVAYKLERPALKCSLIASCWLSSVFAPQHVDNFGALVWKVLWFESRIRLLNYSLLAWVLVHEARGGLSLLAPSHAHGRYSVMWGWSRCCQNF